MRHSRIKIVLFVLPCTPELYTQRIVPATGGDTIGNVGSSSYSIGQVAYTTNTGTNGAVVQGVQQPYEISTIVGIELAEINLLVNIVFTSWV